MRFVRALSPQGSEDMQQNSSHCTGQLCKLSLGLRNVDTMNVPRGMRSRKHESVRKISATMKRES